MRVKEKGHSEAPFGLGLDQPLALQLEQLWDDGWDIAQRFDHTTGEHGFHPFTAAEYGPVLKALLPYRAPGVRFLEWGSASGVITIMADLLGFDASGIELDESLASISMGLAEKFGSGAKFVAGSFLPEGYRFAPPGGDGRIGTIGTGPSGYRMLGRSLDEFDVVFGYPWGGEEPPMLDLMRRYGGKDAVFLMNTVNDGVRVYRQ